MVRVEVHPESTFELHPLRILPDGDEYLVGRPEAASYLAMDRPALDVLRRMGDGHALGRIKRDLCAELNEPEVVLGDFVERLLDARLVRRVDGTPLPDGDVSLPAVVSPPPDLSRRLCSPAAAALYALVGLAAVTIGALDPARYLAGPVTFLRAWGYPVATLVTLLLGWVLVAKREAAHWVAARALGVPARVTLGHRLVFPVLQTNLTALWSVPRRKRIPIYLAGMIGDALVAAGAIVALAGATALGLTPIRPLERLLYLTVFLSLAALLWQLCCFLRTDVYYALADLLRCRNLYEDAWRYLRSRPGAWLGRHHGGARSPQSPRELRIVRAYALFMLAGTALYLALFATYAAGVAVFVTTGSAPGAMPYAGAGNALDRATAALVLGLVVVLVGSSVLRTRRRRRAAPRYRLVAPPGL